MVWFLRVILVLCVSFLSVSVLPTLGGWLPLPNILLGAAVGLALTGRAPHALLWAGLGGFILDLMLPLRGFYTLSLVSIVVFSNWLMRALMAHPPIIVQWLVVLGAAASLPTLEVLVAGEQWSSRWLMAVASNLLGMALILLMLRFVPVKESSPRIQF